MTLNKVVEEKDIIVAGMFGLGTVGVGVWKIIRKMVNIKLKTVVVQDKEKDRKCHFDNSFFLSDNLNDILDDDEINCVIEVMGGVPTAYYVVGEAIKKGKHVITANKTLIARFMNSIEEMLNKKPQVQFLYEAAVCGGIPIINTVKRGFVGDEIQSIYGIVNGTTNFVLSKMRDEKIDYSMALEMAKEEGYAEEDPTADVDGLDSRSKIYILSRLAFGITIDEDSIFCQGISQVSSVDFDYASVVKHTIKLVACAEKSSLDDKENYCDVNIYVSPVMVPLENPIASVNSATNIVVINSKNVGCSYFAGLGAGRLPTANSVAADVADLAAYVSEDRKKLGYEPFGYVNKFVTFKRDFEADFYFRLVVDDQLGIINKVSNCFAKHGISIYSILQTPIVNRHNVSFAIISHRCLLSQVLNVYHEIKNKRQEGEMFDFVNENPFFMPYIL